MQLIKYTWKRIKRHIWTALFLVVFSAGQAETNFKTFSIKRQLSSRQIALCFSFVQVVVTLINLVASFRWRIKPFFVPPVFHSIIHVACEKGSSERLLSKQFFVVHIAAFISNLLWLRASSLLLTIKIAFSLQMSGKMNE